MQPTAYTHSLHGAQGHGYFMYNNTLSHTRWGDISHHVRVGVPLQNNAANGANRKLILFVCNPTCDILGHTVANDAENRICIRMFKPISIVLQPRTPQAPRVGVNCAPRPPVFPPTISQNLTTKFSRNNTIIITSWHDSDITYEHLNSLYTTISDTANENCRNKRRCRIISEKQHHKHRHNKRLLF